MIKKIFTNESLITFVDEIKAYINSAVSTKANSNHTHSSATTSTSGFMTSDMVTKLNGIATGANAYVHPSYTARTGVPASNQAPAFGGTFSVNQITSNSTGHVTAANSKTITIPNTLSNGSGTAGLIKTTSTVTSNSGYTACPVINGVPYYKDSIEIATVSEVEGYLGI